MAPLFLEMARSCRSIVYEMCDTFFLPHLSNDIWIYLSNFHGCCVGVTWSFLERFWNICAYYFFNNNTHWNYLFIGSLIWSCQIIVFVHSLFREMCMGPQQFLKLWFWLGWTVFVIKYYLQQFWPYVSHF